MFIRFETDIYFKGTTCRKGIFAALGDLKRRKVISLEDYILYRNTAEWFNKNIGLPTCYMYPLTGGIQFNSASWFKLVLGTHMDKALCVANLLKKYGIGVNTLFATEEPGKVIYEDELQVVVMHCDSSYQ